MEFQQAAKDCRIRKFPCRLFRKGQRVGIAGKGAGSLKKRLSARIEKGVPQGLKPVAVA